MNPTIPSSAAAIPPADGISSPPLTAPPVRNSNKAQPSAEAGYKPHQLIGLLLGPFLALILFKLPVPEGMSLEGWHTIAIALLIITWWVTEPIPMPVTSLLPIILFPAAGIFDIKTATTPYASPYIFLYIGGFSLAIAMERWGLHTRLALNVVRLIGTSSRAIVGGVLVATALISMWISNTATVVMMMPIALSIITLMLEEGAKQGHDMQPYHHFAKSLMIGIAYAASIGGIATLIGTPTNTILAAFLRENYQIDLGFFSWMVVAVPFSVVLLWCTWIVLVRIVFPAPLTHMESTRSLIEKECRNLGSMSKGERLVAWVFGITALLWVLRQPLTPYVPFHHFSDEMIAMISMLALFLIPVNLNKGEFLLTWKAAEKLPWGILLLFGGGLSLASALEKTGLIVWFGNYITSLGSLSSFEVVFLVTLLSLAFTQIMVNFTLVAIFLPVVGIIAKSFGTDLFLATIPVTIAASCAFLMPMSTAPNAVVFAGGHVTITDMIRAGVWVIAASLILLMAVTYLILPFVFSV